MSYHEISNKMSQCKISLNIKQPRGLDFNMHVLLHNVSGALAFTDKRAKGQSY